MKTVRKLVFLIPLALAPLLFQGAGSTQSSLSPPPPGAQETRTRPPLEPPASPVTPAVPDVLSSAAGSAAPQGVSGGVVVVSSLPSAPLPAEFQGYRSHIQGELFQDQILEEGTVRDLLPAPGEEYFEPQQPVVPSERSAAPGGFVRQWTALSNTGWIPPDNVMAVGPNHVVEAVNSGFAIYSKFGTVVQGYTTFASFLNTPVPWNGFIFDPRVVYDATHQKFVMLALGRDDTNVRSWFWLAVSQTSDPTSGWWIWRFDSTDTTGASTAWLDYAGLAADTWGVYVTGNFFYFTGGYRGSNIWSINPDIFNGGATNGWRFWDLRWPSNAQAFAIQPAHPHSVNASQQTFFVNTFSGSGSQVLLWKMSGDRTNAPTLTSVAINTAGYEAINMNVDQPGSATDIDGLDARVMNAVYSQGRVFFTLTDDVNNNGDASGWLTVKLNVSANTNEWQHLLWGGAGWYYFFPSVTILGGSSPNANLAVFGSWTQNQAGGGGTFASGLFKIYDNQPADVTGPFVGHVAGAAAYVALDSNGINRWGDYSGDGYDWQCGHVWGTVEAANTLNRWLTNISAYQFGNEPICPQMEVTTPNGGQVWNAGTNRTITWMNQGLPAANNIYVFFNDGVTDRQISGPLAPTATSFNWLVAGFPTTQGKIFVGSWNGSSYDATDRSDNFFTVTAPDLRVISPSASKTLLLPNEAFTINATANNLGNGSSNVSTTLRYFRSSDAVITPADVSLGTDPIPVLSSSGSSAQSIGVTAPATPGNYWIGACVDAVAGESNTGNQCSSAVAITVARPDLIISAINAPASANPGSSVNLANTVRNQGTIGTGAGFRVGLYYSPDSACTTGDTLLGSRMVGALGPGGSSSANSTVTIPAGAAAGTRYLCAIADDLNQVPETSEANNVGTDPLTINALTPTVNLKVNGLDAAFPAAVASSGPVRLTLDMTPGSTPLDHYFAIVIGGSLFWVTPGGVSATPAPLANFTPVALTNSVLLDVPNWPSGPTIFLWLMLNGGTVINQDIIQVNVASP